MKGVIALVVKQYDKNFFKNKFLIFQTNIGSLILILETNESKIDENPDIFENFFMESLFII